MGRITFGDFAKRYSPAAEILPDSLSMVMLGEEAAEKSALYMFHHIKSGTGLINVLSDGKDGGQYRVRVILSSPVKTISQQGYNRCTVETENALVFQCKRVVVSVPSTLYPLIEFSPALPDPKYDYAENIQLGMYAKTISVYERPWWRGTSLSGIITSVNPLISFSRDTCVEEDKQYSITCFIIGDTGRRWSKLPAGGKAEAGTSPTGEAFSGTSEACAQADQCD
jgi:monoamine oxidase